MQLDTIKTVLSRPALHIALAICFAVAFSWPIFAMTQPSRVFHFLYGSWFVCLLMMFAISRGEASEENGIDIEAEDNDAASQAAPAPEQR